MDNNTVFETLILVCGVVLAVLGPAKVRQLRRQLNETFERAEELQSMLELAKETVDLLEYENIELIERRKAGDAPGPLVGPDM